MSSLATSPLDGRFGVLLYFAWDAPSRRNVAMGLACAVSLLLHVSGYYWWGERYQEPAFEQEAPEVTRVSVNLVKPVPPAPPVEVPLEVPVEAVVEPPPPPKVAEPEPRPRPRPVPARTPRTAPPPAIAPAAPPVEVAKPIARPAPAAVPQRPAGPTAEQLRERYLQDLFAHIERHKFYPSAARRQGMEASVQVSFVLSGAGTIRDLKVMGGPKLLRLAAEQTLRRAAPLPAPPTAIDTPLRVEYLMAFALQ